MPTQPPHEIPPAGAGSSTYWSLSAGADIYCGAENALLRQTTEDALQHWNQSGRDSDAPPPPPTANWLPLVLYGESGTGKSHLARCLVTRWAQQRADKKANLLATADLARALGRNELREDVDQFTAQQKSVKFLVIDDIHQLSKKPAADAWLTHLLDYRAQRQRPTVLTCQGPIRCKKLSTRLRSRLLGGLCIELKFPESATRREIIQSAFAQMEVACDAAEVERLVQRTAGKSVRGVWSSVISWKLPTASDPSESTTGSAVKGEFISQLLKTTAKKFGVRLSDLKGPSRRKNTVLARAVAMYLLRQLTTMSLAEVGTHFRDRDHTTVRHACNKINRLLSTEPAVVGDAIASICQSLHVVLPDECFSTEQEECA